MATLSLLQWLALAVVVFGLVVPAVLAACMIWLRPARRSVLRHADALDDVAGQGGFVVRDGF